MKCGKQLEYNTDELCGDCTRRSRSFERGFATFPYTDAMRKSVYSFKYNNRREYASFYATSIFTLYREQIERIEPDALIPVPLHKSKYRKRGYNQAELVAAELSRLTGIPLDSGILKRTRNTRPQKELDDEQRNKNISNAFQISKNVVKYKKVILIDDIYTTGTTINECAKELKKAGVEKVFFITICIGRGY